MSRYELTFNPEMVDVFLVTFYFNDPHDFYGCLEVPLAMSEEEFEASIPFIKYILDGGLNNGYDNFINTVVTKNLAPKRVVDFFDMWTVGEYGVEDPTLSEKKVEIKYFDEQGRRFNVEVTEW